MISTSVSTSADDVAGRLRARLSDSGALTDKPDFALVGVLRVPELESSPWRAIYKRVLMALGILFLAAFVVYLDRSRRLQRQPERRTVISRRVLLCDGVVVDDGIR